MKAEIFSTKLHSLHKTQIKHFNVIEARKPSF